MQWHLVDSPFYSPRPPSVVGACGGDDDSSGVTLSPDGEAGRSVFQSKGCGSCHGTGVGPDLENLYGTDVELDDGTVVVADDAYLRRAITDPGAQKVDGYDVRMPTADVSDEELAQLIAYIRDIGGDAGGRVAGARREVAESRSPAPSIAVMAVDSALAGCGDDSDSTAADPVDASTGGERRADGRVHDRPGARCRRGVAARARGRRRRVRP